METLGYYNGKYGELSEMTVPMLDRVCYFGDGVYDATCARNHKIYCLDEHVDRFFNSAGLLHMVIPHTKDALKALLRELVCKVDAGEQFVYWQLTRGTAPRSHTYTEGPGNLWVMLRPAPVQDMRQAMKLITLEDTRFLHCNIKTLNLLPNVMAAQQAEAAGCDEAVLHRGETVTECAHSNVHILKNGVFHTHPTDHHILPGITRSRLWQLCHQLNIPVDEAPFTLKDLREADEILVTSASTFCRAACELDGQPVGGKDPALLHRIQDALDADFHSQTDL